MIRQLEQLDYQQQAIQSVIDVFKNTPRNTFINSTFEGIRFNNLFFDDSHIKNNIQAVQRRNKLQQESVDDDQDICIEMETGTGKTLVYIQTIFELFKQYGFSKFIILVPSIAIREGVISTFETFKIQLENKYNIVPHYFAYDSKHLNKISEFAESQHLQIMIMTLQSFDSDDNILNRNDREDQLLPDKSLIEVIAQTRPFVIMDEPQEGMGTNNAIVRISNLKPLFKLRYSATHKLIKNLIYQLTPSKAYKQNLVKKIVVIAVSEKNDQASLQLELEKIHPSKNGGGSKLV